ncbi:MAG: 3-phosphoshikimate 1-carboxyvinyltransferase [Alphaproteobacteria bacterium]|nr:3-phosphoshikimate 1-carboxyvinyltransferase [Alphaproteobacteria bacterium]
MHAAPQQLISSRCGALAGDITPPGDKSISHRSIMFGGIAEGTTTVRGLLEGEDVLATVAALRAMGADIRKDENKIWYVTGVGDRGLHPPATTLDMGNSGTSARLLIGLVTGNAFTARFSGDASLCKRPMGRVIDPLSLMGATFESSGGKLPLTVTGSPHPKAITYELPVVSAQVKSAILLAGLGVEGTTTVIEQTPTRDHSENMLRGFGAQVTITKRADGADIISITGKPRLMAQNITVPADPSSAAFPLVAALLNPGSHVILRNVGLNPRRAGLIETLVEMGADILFENRRSEGGEPVADLIVTGSELTGIDVPPERAPSMIDEYPILAVAASCARGTMRMRGLGELRVKESDRLALMAQGLTQCGVKLEVEGDDLIIHGTGTPPQGGAAIATAMDHRIAMSFLVLGTRTAQPIRIDDGAFIATSFPGFVAMMNNLGAKIA